MKSNLKTLVGKGKRYARYYTRIAILRSRRTVRQTRQHVGDKRLLRLGAAALIVFTVSIPAFQYMLDIQSYQLNAEALQVVGKNNDNLVKKFSYNAQTDTWQFNKDGSASQEAAIKKTMPAGSKAAAGLAGALAQMKAQVGGNGAKDKSLYSADLAADPTKGITYYDNNTDLSFSMVPQFKMHAGKLWQGRVVYPVNDTTKLVYTAKNNGFKEDIVLSKATNDSLSFTYKLNLPKELEAKVQDDGSIGIYSADPSLYGNISYGSDADEAKIQSARETAQKTHLVFAIPAPILKDKHGTVQPAAYHLDGYNNLTVQANNLQRLHYPLSIDPSVVITSSSDFASGNDEGNISFDSGAISAATSTGGDTDVWAAKTSLVQARNGAATATYNGYMYVIGGDNGSTTYYNDVQYAQLSAGTIGTWQYTYNSTSSGTGGTGFTNARSQLAAVAYNSNLYIFGGHGSSTYYNDVQVAPINTDGTLGTWQYTYNSASSASFSGGFAAAQAGLAAVAYNGTMYILGGYESSTQYDQDVQYAAINANGTLGAWSTTTSFTNGRAGHTVVAYNGYLYVLGGYYYLNVNSNGYFSDVQYAPINTDGTVGTWATTTSFNLARQNHTTVAYKGYMYVMGGNVSGTAGQLVQYAPINANGTLGNWDTSSNIFPTVRKNQVSVVYQGYIYTAGGITTGTTPLATTIATSIKQAGEPGPINAGATFSNTRYGQVVVAYNNCLYNIGGFSNGTESIGASYSIVGSDGSLGTWTTTTTLGTGNDRAYAAGAIYNGYVYYMGGSSGGTYYNQVLYSQINANGCGLGTWTAVTATYKLPITVRTSSAVAYNGYLYNIGGRDGTADRRDVYYAPLNPNTGALNAPWQSTTILPNSVGGRGTSSVTWEGYVYVSGGYNADGTAPTGVFNSVAYAPINSNGTLGSWTTATNTFTNARYGHTMSVYNNNLYIGGGFNPNTSAYYSDIQYAALNQNGSVGVFSTATSTLAQTMDWQGGLAYNGYLYIVGGHNNSNDYATTSYYRINNGGSGTVASWSTGTALSTGRAAHATVAYNGYLYVLGGNTSSGNLNDVQYASLNPSSGAIGTWNTTASFATARFGLTAVAYNGYMYVAGGYGGSLRNDVQYAAINANGTLGTWATTTSFTTARAYHASAAYNGYLYILGGTDLNNITYSDVQYASISSNGTLGSWATTTVLPGERAGLTAVVYNGYMYVTGGIDYESVDPYSFLTKYNDVQFATINSNGTLGSWTASTPFNTKSGSISSGRAFHTSFIYNGYMYILGGDNDNANSFNDVQFAPVNSNGGVGNWSTTVNFATARSNGGTAVYNGYVYTVGGSQVFMAGGTRYSDSQYGSLNVINHAALYSKLINLGTTAAAAYVTYNGTLYGNSSVQFKTAGSTGALGTSSSAVIGSAPALISSCLTSGSSQYVWLVATLDDTQTFSFGPLANASSLTDMTVTYAPNAHAAPNVRLYGGKFFSSQTLQGLDVCGP